MKEILDMVGDDKLCLVRQLDDWDPVKKVKARMPWVPQCHDTGFKTTQQAVHLVSATLSVGEMYRSWSIYNSIPRCGVAMWPRVLNPHKTFV